MSKWFDRGDIILIVATIIMVFILASTKSHRIENPTPNSITVLEGKITSLETRVKNLEQRNR